MQNPIHFTKGKETNTFEAYIKASETFTVCCGRNIAFISEAPHRKKSSSSSSNELLALTWIDPVTTMDVVPSNDAAVTLRRLSETEEGIDLMPVNENVRRFLKAKKSHIHGTNGYLLPLHSTSELLGIAHFHRPEGRDSSHYARHGHHYSKYCYHIVDIASSKSIYLIYFYSISKHGNSACILHHQAFKYY